MVTSMRIIPIKTTIEDPFVPLEASYIRAIPRIFSKSELTYFRKRASQILSRYCMTWPEIQLWADDYAQAMEMLEANDSRDIHAEASRCTTYVMQANTALVFLISHTNIHLTRALVSKFPIIYLLHAYKLVFEYLGSSTPDELAGETLNQIFVKYAFASYPSDPDNAIDRFLQELPMTDSDRVAFSEYLKMRFTTVPESIH